MTASGRTAEGPLSGAPRARTAARLAAVLLALILVAMVIGFGAYRVISWAWPHEHCRGDMCTVVP